MHATVSTSLPDAVWSRSVDDRLTDIDTAADGDGFIWAVSWRGLYPGGTVLSPSPMADRWSQAIGEPFHEVRIETNVHTITLVATDVVSTTLATPDDGP